LVYFYFCICKQVAKVGKIKQLTGVLLQIYFMVVHGSYFPERYCSPKDSASRAKTINMFGFSLGLHYLCRKEDSLYHEKHYFYYIDTVAVRKFFCFGTTAGHYTHQQSFHCGK
jgi:hypothetical protein